MRAPLFIAVLLYGLRLHAAVPEIQIPGGISSSLNREIILTPKEGEPGDPNALSVVVRYQKSHKTIASDIIVPFGQITEAEPYMKASWSPTGEYIAFNLRDCRHDTETFVYRVTKSAITRIEIPYYWDQARKVLKPDADCFGGTDTPIRWLDEKTLLMRSQGGLRDESKYDLLVTIEFTDSKPLIHSVKLNK